MGEKAKRTLTRRESCKQDEGINNDYRPKLQALQGRHTQARMDLQALEQELSLVRAGKYGEIPGYVEPLANTALCIGAFGRTWRKKAPKSSKGLPGQVCSEIIPSVNRALTSRKGHIRQLKRKIIEKNIDLDVLNSNIEINEGYLAKMLKSFNKSDCYGSGYTLQR